MGSHYRAYGELNWASQSGNALLTITNPTADKLLRVRSLEVRPIARKMTTTQEAIFKIMRVTGVPSASDANEIALTKADTSATTPAGVYCIKNASYTAGDVIFPQLVVKAQSPATALAKLSCPMNVGMFRGVEAALGNKPSALERITVADGEAVALVPTYVDRGLPIRIEAALLYKGAYLFFTTNFAIATCEGLAPWCIVNANGDSNTLEIVRLSVTEMGDVTTPFFQVVPVNPKPDRYTDAYFLPTVLKYDTAAAAFPGIISADVACSPASGIPEQYLSDASAGSPKGVNYLHTKDFLGPAYMVYFPEHDANGAGVRGGTFGMAVKRKGTRIIDDIAPIYIRPGESIGVVTSAELATAATAVPVSGYAPFEFGCDVEVTDLVTPTIRFTGLQTGTKIALVTKDTETLVTLLTESGGSAEYTFTSAPGTYVDARILAAGYVFQQIDDIELLAAVQVFPIDQVADLVYDAGLSEGVTFSTATVKRIIVDAGNSSISVPAVYTEWVDWALTSNNLQYYHAFENQGGADIDPGAGTMIPYYCYLVNSWQVRPQESDHTLNVTGGILLVSGGGDPFVDTLGAYTVRINYQQPVQAITVSTGGGTAPTVEEIREEMDDNSEKLASIDGNTKLIPALL